MSGSFPKPVTDSEHQFLLMRTAQHSLKRTKLDAVKPVIHTDIGYLEPRAVVGNVVDHEYMLDAHNRSPLGLVREIFFVFPAQVTANLPRLGLDDRPQRVPLALITHLGFKVIQDTLGKRPADFFAE